MKSVKKILFLPLLMLILLVSAWGCTEPTPDDTEGGEQDPPVVDPSKYVYNTPETKKLKLTESFEGKDFIQDGIGEVSVVRYVDGDTSVFKTKSGESFTTRYSGINTPESTYRIEPFGFAASKENKKLIKECLDAGGKVVLQAEDMTKRTDSNGRHLAWVWLISADGDSKLLNLELAELGYAFVKCDVDEPYYPYLLNGMSPLMNAKVRIYGEQDPSYDYNKEGTPMTIKEIRETYGTPEQIEAYGNGGETTTEDGELIVTGAGTLVVVSGVVVRKNGDKNAYIQQYDPETGQYYGIYVYGGYNQISKLLLGANVEITAKIGYYYGSLQLTDLTSDKKIKLYNLNGEAVPEEMSAENTADINNYQQIGKLVKVSNLKVTKITKATDTRAFTIQTSYVDSKGNTKRLDIRVDQNVILRDANGQEITAEYFEEKTIESVIGIISYYNGATSNITYSNGRIQLMLTDMADIVFSE